MTVQFVMDMISLGIDTCAVFRLFHLRGRSWGVTKF